jgi:hypothetical protein
VLAALVIVSAAGCNGGGHDSDPGDSHASTGQSRTTKANQKRARTAPRYACYVQWNYITGGEVLTRRQTIRRAQLYASWATRSDVPALAAASGVYLDAARHPRNAPAAFSQTLTRVNDTCDRLGYGRAYWENDADLDDPNLPHA